LAGPLFEAASAFNNPEYETAAKKLAGSSQNVNMVLEAAKPDRPELKHN